MPNVRVRVVVISDVGSVKVTEPLPIAFVPPLHSEAFEESIRGEND